MADELACLDATAQAELVRRGEVAPLGLVDAAIARVEKLNPALNQTTEDWHGLVGAILVIAPREENGANTRFAPTGDAEQCLKVMWSDLAAGAVPSVFRQASLEQARPWVDRRPPVLA